MTKKEKKILDSQEWESSDGNFALTGTMLIARLVANGYRTEASAIFYMLPAKVGNSFLVSQQLSWTRVS
jgi:hypothetical protein